MPPSCSSSRRRSTACRSSPPAACRRSTCRCASDLRSRLGGGLVYALAPLAEAETRAAIRREAQRRGIALPDEVLDYLLARFERDLTHLMALLDRLDAYAMAAKRAVTVPLVRAMLEADARPADEGASAAAPGARSA